MTGLAWAWALKDQQQRVGNILFLRPGELSSVIFGISHPVDDILQRFATTDGTLADERFILVPTLLVNGAAELIGIPNFAPDIQRFVSYQQAPIRNTKFLLDANRLLASDVGTSFGAVGLFKLNRAFAISRHLFYDRIVGGTCRAKVQPWITQRCHDFASEPSPYRVGGRLPVVLDFNKDGVTASILREASLSGFVQEVGSELPLSRIVNLLPCAIGNNGVDDDSEDAHNLNKWFRLVPFALMLAGFCLNAYGYWGLKFGNSPLWVDLVFFIAGIGLFFYGFMFLLAP